MTLKVNLSTLAVEAEPLPAFLAGLSRADLLDLSWVDPAMGLGGYGWWPTVDASPPVGKHEYYGEAVYTADPVRKCVVIECPVLTLAQAQIEAIAMTEAAALQAAVVSATQARLDAFAKTRNYDNILSACTYVFSQVPRFAAEGQAAVDARDLTWSALYTLLGEVQAGVRPMPASFAEIEPGLPALVWPAGA